MGLGLGGPLELPMGCEGDRKLVDLVDGEWEKAVVAKGGWVVDAWRVSDVITEDGGQKLELEEGGEVGEGGAGSTG